MAYPEEEDLVQGTDRLVKENEDTRKQILEETEELKDKRKAEVQVLCAFGSQEINLGK